MVEEYRYLQFPDGTICECCHPSAAFGRDGGLDLMWRNVLDGRAISTCCTPTRHTGSGRRTKWGMEPGKLMPARWTAGAWFTPVREPLRAWRRMNDIFIAEPDKHEMKIGEGKDVTLAAAGDRVYAAWIEDDQLVLWTNGSKEKAV